MQKKIQFLQILKPAQKYTIPYTSVRSGGKSES